LISLAGKFALRFRGSPLPVFDFNPYLATLSLRSRWDAQRESHKQEKYGS